MANLRNFLLFQLVWFSCVLGAANGLPQLSIISLSAFLLIHFYYTDQLNADMLIVALCVSLGLVLDGLWIYLGYVSYLHMSFSPVPPYWLLCLWVAFALTINHSMSWMQKRYWLAFIAGGLFGPLSYLAGERLGAMQWQQPVAATVAFIVSWALLMPLLFFVADKRRENVMLDDASPLK